MTGSYPPAALQAHLGYWLRAVSNAVSHSFSRKMEGEGVTVAEWVFLRTLFDVERIAPSELAERMGMTKGAISKLADRLVAKELIKRDADPEDGRGQTLCLQKPARKLVLRLAQLAEVPGGGDAPRVLVTSAAALVRRTLPADELLAYCTAIMRVYNRFGRRDNKYKARVKILVHELGLEEFRREVETEYAAGDHAEGIALAADELDRIRAYFAPPAYERLPDHDPLHEPHVRLAPEFAAWVRQNTVRHKVPGYAIVNVSLKPIGGIPGDATSAQMRTVAALADEFSHGEIRVTHEQNLVLPDVRKSDLFALWSLLDEAGLATPNSNLISDIIACPGMDYCALATARSIPIAQAISNRFAALDRQREVGELKIKISGCINACGHHHVGHIGILGLDKQGREFYQITLGGSADNQAAIGKIIGPGFSAEQVPDAIERIVAAYLELRRGEDEPFIEVYRRMGDQPFKERLYAAA